MGQFESAFEGQGIQPAIVTQITYFSGGLKYSAFCRIAVSLRIAALARRRQIRTSGNPVRLDDLMKKPNSSMQLTRGADYAVRVVIQLALSGDDGRLSLPELAQATDAPESFLSKVLQSLARAGLVTSRRGQAGGFRITQRGRESSMRAVIEAIDGPICLNVCLAHGPSCPRKTHCPAHPVWARAQLALFDVLSSVTVAAMAAQAR